MRHVAIQGYTTFRGAVVGGLFSSKVSCIVTQRQIALQLSQGLRMIRPSSSFRVLIAASLCGLALVGAHAASTVRTIQSSGTAQFVPVVPGRDGVLSAEFAPTFANLPRLQDGPNASGTSASAGLVSSTLKESRKRMVNRSIAIARGAGEQTDGEDQQQSNANLVKSFDGLMFRDQRLANGGNQFSVEPPDQGLCVGNGFVVESVTDVIRVFDRNGNALTSAVDLNTFYGYAAAINRSTGVFGPSLTDPSCYYDPQVKRFFQVILTIDVDPKTGGATGSNHLDLAVSSTSDPRDSWTIYRIPVQDDGTQATPVHANCPCLGDYPHIGADAHGIYLTTNEFPFSGGFNSAQIGPNMSLR